MLHPSPCSRRGLAQFGNPCAARTKGQLTFLWEVSCSKEMLPVFFRLNWRGKGTAHMAQAAPAHRATEGSHTCGSPVGTPMLTGGCTTGLENFPLCFLESLLWEVGTSPGSILRSLGFVAPALFQSRCFVDHEILEGTHCATSWLLCLAAHHVPLRCLHQSF